MQNTLKNKTKKNFFTMKFLLGIPETYNFQRPWAIKLQHEDHLKLGPPNLHSSQGFRENVNSQNEPCQLTENFI